MIRFLASGVTVSHSGDGYWNQKVYNDIISLDKRGVHSIMGSIALNKVAPKTFLQC